MPGKHYTHRAKAVYYDGEPECAICGVAVIDADKPVVRHWDEEGAAVALPPVQRNVARSNGRPTSEAAAAKALPKTGTIRALVLDVIRERGGATDDEVEVALDRTHQSVSAARNTLMRDGYLVASGTVRPTRTGNDATVWRLTEAAEAALGLTRGAA